MKNIPYVAEFYDTYRSPYPRQFYEALRSICPPTACKDVLDVGCGPGLATVELAKHYDQMTGLDSSAEMIRHAASVTNGKSVIWIHGEAEQLPFDNDEFDLLTCGESFHWFRVEDFLSEANRVLKRPGRIALFWPYRFTTDEGKRYERALFQTYREFLKKEGICDVRINLPRKEGKAPEELVVDYLSASGFFDCEMSFIEYSIQWTMANLIGYGLTQSTIGFLSTDQLEELEQAYRVRLTEAGFRDEFISQANVLLMTGKTNAK